MIRINLIRQNQPTPRVTPSSWVGGGIGVLVVLLAGLGGGWWTQTLRVEREGLIQAEMATAQKLAGLQETLGRLSQVKAQKDGLQGSLKALSPEGHATRNPAEVMNIIGESVQPLQVWLDSIQLEHEILELHGQASAMGDVGKCLDQLENTLPMRGLPLVEVQEGANETSAPYSFVIRFTLQGQGLT